MLKNNAKNKSFLNLSSKLSKLGLNNPFDFALHLPIRYEDETTIYSIKQAVQYGMAQIAATVVNQSWVGSGSQKQLLIEVQDQTSTLYLRFINTYPAQVKQFNIGSKWRIRGEIKHGLFGLEIIHPICKNINVPLPKELTAIYSSIAGLPQSYLQSCIKQQVLRICSELEETIPENLLKLQLNNLQLMSLKQALTIIHFPKNNENIDSLLDKTHIAFDRLKFDELLAQQLSLKKMQIELKKYNAPSFSTQNNQLLKTFIKNLPFELTDGQKNAWAEISIDLAKNSPMQRLLQGDVGSGKTIIAALASTQVVGNCFQVALMAPTEILAQQLYNKFILWLEPLGIKIKLLIGATTIKQKNIIKQQIEKKEIDIIIGTHAIIQKDIIFHNLGLAIIDEQHRFGVAQRLVLRTNQANTNQMAHQLMMSATPIPRSLAMSYYANLDVSIMKGLPSGRLPITTKLIDNSKRAEIIERLADNIYQGKQVYWVCPLIEESETLDLENAIQTYELLCASLPNTIRLGLMHGKLPNKEKQELMLKFKEHQIDILVSTTVIEVGVDVPNASLMIIEQAQRFGLAQLHQLRGRVGRGDTQSICILMYQKPLSRLGRERLQTMYYTQDGFVIAQKDLELRGAGEILGAKQSGDMLRFANIDMDIILLEYAVITAKEMLTNYEKNVQKHLNLWVNKKLNYMFA